MELFNSLVHPLLEYRGGKGMVQQVLCGICVSKLPNHFSGFEPGFCRNLWIQANFQDFIPVFGHIIIGEHGKGLFQQLFSGFLFNQDGIIEFSAGTAYGTEHRHILEVITAGFIDTPIGGRGLHGIHQMFPPRLKR